MYIIFSNPDTEAYDDVISGKINHPIYETIPNKNYEVGVGTHLQDNLSHAANARYVALAVNDWNLSM